MFIEVCGSGSSGNGYVLDCDGRVLLLEAGCRFIDIKRILNYDISGIVGMFVSHGHGDHAKYTEEYRQAGIPIFEPYKSEMDRRVVTYDGFVLKSFPLPHDGVENRGVYITCPNGHRILYLTDYEYCGYTFTNQRIQTLLIECNYCKSMIDPEEEKYNHVLRGHASLDVAKEIVRVNKTSDLKNVILCHLSHNSADKYEILDEVRSVVDISVLVTVAEPGLIVDLDREF